VSRDNGKSEIASVFALRPMNLGQAKGKCIQTPTIFATAVDAGVAKLANAEWYFQSQN
jgi:hypothetical protein